MMRLALMLLLGITGGYSMNLRSTEAANPLDEANKAYQKMVFESGDLKLPYRFLEPSKIDHNQKYPLVIFLHGAGERGTDNSKQLIHGLSEFVKSENRRDFPCFVLAPQCPEGKKWVEVDWTLTEHEMPKEMSSTMKLTWDLMHEVVEHHPIDPRRIYITGLSMGGYGTWDIIQRHPDFFAAAIPVCGGADEKYAARLTKLPIWAFHGDLDKAVPVIRTTRMISALKEAGGAPRMTIYSGVGHNSWTATYANREVLNWLFSQRKSAEYPAEKE